MNRLLTIIVILGFTIPALATDIVILSDEGWCNVYLDSDYAGEIPLGENKTTLWQVKPGNYQLKITDAFDKVWYKGLLEVPDADKILLQVEPDSFEVISVSGENENTSVEDGTATDTEGKIRSKIESYPIGRIESLLYVTSKPSRAEVEIDGKDVGHTPYALVNVKAGKYEITIKPKGYDPIQETIEVRDDSVTHLDIEIK